jgi:hypothetical protein
MSFHSYASVCIYERKFKLFRKFLDLYSLIGTPLLDFFISYLLNDISSSNYLMSLYFRMGISALHINKTIVLESYGTIRRVNVELKSDVSEISVSIIRINV